jgi:RND family efflux transporter MFP subunit
MKRKLLTRKSLIVGAIAILVMMLIAVFVARANQAPALTTVHAGKIDLVQEVSVSGKVKAAQSVDLAFEKSGTVARINVKVGDSVKAGTRLGALEAGELYADLAEAEARVETEQATLEELERGLRPEERSVEQAKVSSAESALRDAWLDLKNTLEDTYIEADNAVKLIDYLLNNPRSSSPTLAFAVTTSNVERRISDSRPKIEETLFSWRAEIAKITSDETVADTAIDHAKINLEKVRVYLDDMWTAVNRIAQGSATTAEIDGYKMDVSDARLSIGDASAALIAKEAAVRNAESALELAEKEFEFKNAGTDKEQIKAQAARVGSAQAAVQNINAQIRKTVIVSPIDGVVSKVEPKVGEIFGSVTPAFSVISAGNYQIEVNVQEADIPFVAIGNIAKVTLDAYDGGEMFEAEVIAIDPAETVIDGVSTYKITLQLRNTDARVRSGMTANVDIVTATKTAVIAVPTRAISEHEGAKTLKIKVGEEVREVEVKTGLKASDGNIEIVEGLSEGDEIVVSEK